ncbi:MAG: hypothetical protein HOE19_01935 [Candidatus Komeilibacteria bacterium]|jgi:hypothetical protein|nr:hypothetical protein [Candidatus Komeilibacteria bacterium]MBT4447460.1 hypothetical protein [Candidatus Komeilibacteria bacterium]
MKFQKYKLTLLSLLFTPLAVLAADIVGQAELREAATIAKFGMETDVYVIATRWINGFLSIFMMVFTYFVISAGFMWMTSGGNVEKVSAAKATLKNALIGLIVALTAYSLARYVMLALGQTTGIA